MKNIINEINFKNEILIADGATGTNYFDDGLQAGDPPELWNIEKSQSVIQLHRKFIQAGANIILTNTFGANELRLKFHGIDSKLNEININAVKLAKAAVTDLNKSNLEIAEKLFKKLATDVKMFKSELETLEKEVKELNPPHL